MHRYFRAALLFLATLSAVARAYSEEPDSKTTWNLVWQDEFNTSELSDKNWNKLLREQSKHGEVQYYVPDEAYIENDCLRLRSQKRDYGTQHYTSGRVDTSGKFAPTYGRFEIRAKLPGGQGLWPAHWLYPQHRDWRMERLMAAEVEAGREKLIPEERPWYTEIDIMEFLGHETNILYGTLHYHSFKGEKKSNSGTLKGKVDYTKDFHNYELEWEPNEIRWYVDGELIHKTSEGVPHTPHYIILNTAIGGTWPGAPDETSTFPQYHDIDYVRVYDKEDYFKLER